MSAGVRVLGPRDRSKEAIDAWVRKDGATFLRALGIGDGDRVLDFGCGPGGYVLPLAQVVGPTGRVIAVDKGFLCLKLLRKRIAKSPHRDIIDVHRTDGGLTIDWIAAASLDAVLLFDVLQHISDWDTLFTSLRRVLKPDGLLLVNPSHLSHPGKVDVERMKVELIAHGFALERTERARVLHYDFLHEEEILVFRVQ
jgi:ubiquinone/menaquinone biosynthesis C-methylase UbiE